MSPSRDIITRSVYIRGGENAPDYGGQPIPFPSSNPRLSPSNVTLCNAPRSIVAITLAAAAAELAVIKSQARAGGREREGRPPHESEDEERRGREGVKSHYTMYSAFRIMASFQQKGYWDHLKYWNLHNLALKQGQKGQSNIAWANVGCVVATYFSQPGLIPFAMPLLPQTETHNDGAVAARTAHSPVSVRRAFRPSIIEVALLSAWV